MHEKESEMVNDIENGSIKKKEVLDSLSDAYIERKQNFEFYKNEIYPLFPKNKILRSKKKRI